MPSQLLEYYTSDDWTIKFAFDVACTNLILKRMEAPKTVEDKIRARRRRFRFPSGYA